jgi:hypothetical protein
MPIEQIKIRAQVVVGSLTVETPYILSFNVNKQRGSLSSFSANLKIPRSGYSQSISGGVYLKIYAGIEGNMPLIYTGIIEKVQITPVFDDPSFVNLSISGTDTLKLLAGKKFTRRCRSTKATWVTINSVVKETLKSGKFKYTKQNYFVINDGDFSASPVTRAAPPPQVANPPLAPNAGEPVKVTLVVRPYSDQEVV